MADWGRSGWIVRAGEGRRVAMEGPHSLEVLLEGSQVKEAMGVFVFDHAPITVNPPHQHLDWMKVLYVLEGEYDVRVGDAEMTAGPGDLVVVPAGSQHTFTTVDGGRILFACAPAGNEELFLAQERLGPGATDEQLAAIDERLGTRRLVEDGSD